jgi:hypothetical protein
LRGCTRKQAVDAPSDPACSGNRVLTDWLRSVPSLTAV